MKSDYQYDIALSFAGEDRPLVSRVAHYLRDHDVSVFYDEFEEAELWGKNLYVYLRDIYRDRARFTVVFCSRHYADKLWTNHERESAQERAFRESYEYILPVRFDDTEIPGLPSTVAYLDLRKISEEDLLNKILAKLGRKLAAGYRVNHGYPQPSKTDLRFGKGSVSDLSQLGVLIISHGSMAHDLLLNAEMIAGELPKCFGALSINWSESFDAALAAVKSAVRRLDSGHGVLILTDMYGGTPCNLAVAATGQSNSVAIVCGVNLPMVLRLAVSVNDTSSMTVQEIAHWVRNKAQRSMAIVFETLTLDPTPKPTV